MPDILIIFIMVSILSTLILGLLILIIKEKPKTTIAFEMIGYLLLLTSFIWGGIDNKTTEIANGQNNAIINEKLNILWNFERAKIGIIESTDTSTLYQRHDSNNEYWDYLEGSGDWVSEQEKFSNKAQYSLIGLSALLVAAGRIGELFISKKKKNKE